MEIFQFPTAFPPHRFLVNQGQVICILQQFAILARDDLLLVEYSRFLDV